MRKIFAITLNYNSESKTHTCLASLQKLTCNNIALRCIVIDNASDTPFVLTKLEEKTNVKLLRSEKNLGFTGGSNLGIEFALQSGADFILLINNDTQVDKNLLTEFLAAMDADLRVGITVPKIYFTKGHEYHKQRYKKNDLGKVLWYAGGGIDWKNVVSFHKGVDEVDSGQYDKEEAVDFATGCCMLVKRSVFESVGLFDNIYFLYFEDADFSMRVRKKNFSIVYTPKAYMWHESAGSSGGSGSGLHDYFLTRNRMIFGFRFAPLRSKIALIRESITLLLTGRKFQKKGIQDFYFQRFEKGSFA